MDELDKKMSELEPTKEKSKKINAINRETVHQICSGQVVLDLATAVKELVENSLDSGATVIEVKLTDYGKSCITVVDNGSGILEQDFEGLGLKHHTSKLRDFSDLTEVNTFGFRGEALSSLCALSQLSIITRATDSKHGFKLEFDTNGVLQKKEAYAREKGTTIHVRNVFKNLPVRAKEFERNLKKEYARTVQVLYSYCLVSTDKKITCSNTISGKPTNLIVNTSSSSVLNNVSTIFGKKSLDGIVKLELLAPDEATLQDYNLPGNVTVDFEWDCYISTCNHNCGRSAPDRQFFYVNGRPCDLTKVNKLINQTYHKYNNKQYPFIFLNLILDKQSTDVNVTPDKRVIFFTQEKLILAALRYSLTVKWEKLQGNLTTNSSIKSNILAKRPVSPTDINPPAKRLQSFQLSSTVKIENQESVKIETTVKQESDDTIESESLSLVVEVPMNMDVIKMKMTERYSLAPQKEEKKRVKYRALIQANQSSEAEKELQKELSKESFTQMKVIGQFNLGFIIACLEDDLFIIDQHATDEKFRFEKLNNETQIKTQKLIIPKPLNLSALNETILLEHPEIFETNGFTFKINTAANVGSRVELTGIPVSGNWQFGQDDIEELIFLIREGDAERTGNKMIRPSRVRQMLASRACRGAVMIGTALNEAEMQRLLNQMSQMQQPWSCPHGRPTIRHLLCLLLAKKSIVPMQKLDTLSNDGHAQS